MYRMECVLLNAKGAQTSLIRSYGRQSTESFCRTLARIHWMGGIVAEVDGSDLLSVFDKRLPIEPAPKLGKVELATMSNGRLMVVSRRSRVR